MSKWLTKFLPNKNGADKPDRFKKKPNMSVLSVPSKELLAGKKPYLFDGDLVLQNFEERIAIAQFDGGQTSLQAQRIAYLDAFVDVLVTLLHKNSQANQRENWLDQRVKDARTGLLLKA